MNRNQSTSFLFSAVAKRVVGKRKHCFKKCPLIVSLLPEAAVSSETEDEEDDISETNDTSNGNGHHTGTVNDVCITASPL